ncbi:hypothetical protein [Streptomyces sp. NBC_00286]|uniref:hypothetical protein n=1 Tax=Streptomyces sp. NBC_00286 TaxID=2975701 RepID=UPI002E2BDE50|nr:hypothetical protein [Streptomyces sp. NBC_00286]
MMTLAPQPAPQHADEDAAMPPRADCIADSAGGLTFDLTGSARSGAAYLLLRRRGGDEEVSLPLTPAADGRLRATLPSSVELPEGRWDAYAQLADGEPQRLVPGINDLRALVDRVPDGDTGGRIAVRIPYATKHGNLTVRSWLRVPHAEAGELYVKEGELSVRGRLYGETLTPDAYAEVRARHAPETTLRADITADRTEFRFTVGYGALTEGVWDLWLCPAGDSGPRVRIARLLDDVADKKPIFTYPKVTLKTEQGDAVAGPYYTADNDLSVTVTAVS